MNNFWRQEYIPTLSNEGRFILVDLAKNRSQVVNLIDCKAIWGKNPNIIFFNEMQIAGTVSDIYKVINETTKGPTDDDISPEQFINVLTDKSFTLENHFANEAFYKAVDVNKKWRRSMIATNIVSNGFKLTDIMGSLTAQREGNIYKGIAKETNSVNLLGNNAYNVFYNKLRNIPGGQFLDVSNIKLGGDGTRLTSKTPKTKVKFLVPQLPLLSDSREKLEYALSLIPGWREKYSSLIVTTKEYMPLTGQPITADLFEQSTILVNDGALNVMGNKEGLQPSSVAPLFNFAQRRRMELAKAGGANLAGLTLKQREDQEKYEKMMAASVPSTLPGFAGAQNTLPGFAPGQNTNTTNTNTTNTTTITTLQEQEAKFFAEADQDIIAIYNSLSQEQKNDFLSRLINNQRVMTEKAIISDERILNMLSPEERNIYNSYDEVSKRNFIDAKRSTLPAEEDEEDEEEEDEMITADFQRLDLIQNQPSLNQQDINILQNTMQ
jgi:hypothetical protein